jgi:hypothetical protein
MQQESSHFLNAFKTGPAAGAASTQIHPIAHSSRRKAEQQLFPNKLQ